MLPGLFLLARSKSCRLKILVHHAGARPENHFASGHFLQIAPQVLVGDEEDFFFGRHSLDDLAGVSGGDVQSQRLLTAADVLI